MWLDGAIWRAQKFPRPSFPERINLARFPRNGSGSNTPLENIVRTVAHVSVLLAVLKLTRLCKNVFDSSAGSDAATLRSASLAFSCDTRTNGRLSSRALIADLVIEKNAFLSVSVSDSRSGNVRELKSVIDILPVTKSLHSLSFNPSSIFLTACTPQVQRLEAEPFLPRPADRLD